MSLRHTLFTILSLSVGLFFAIISSKLSSAAEASATTPKLTTQQSEELQKLLVEFRAVNKTPEDREKIAGRVFELGPVGVRNLSALIEKQARPQLDHYRDRFAKQAVAIVGGGSPAANVGGSPVTGGKTKVAPTTPNQEITQLRAAVLALKEKKELSKEEIVKVADPAMKQLSELLVIDRNKVLDASPDLQKEREKLGQIAKVWERCIAYYNDQLPTDQKSKDPISFESYLKGEEELSARQSLPMDPNSRAVLAANEKLATKLDPEESRCILACNQTRLLLGLNVCEIDPKLCAAAKDHSHDMETLKFFAHESPVAGKTTPWDRAKRMNTTASAENIFVGITSGKVANEGWFHSPGHHKNMLGDHKRIGVGQSGTYFTEMFGG